MAAFGSGKSHPLTPGVVRVMRGFFLAMTGILACVGVFFVVMGALEWGRAAASAEWPSVQGTIDASEVHHSRSTGGTRRGGARNAYSAGVQYRYVVAGVEHTGSKVSYRVRSEGKSDAQAAVERWPAGSVVPVYYNPADPGQSVLETGWDWLNIIPVGVGLFAVGFCAVFAMLTLRITARMFAVCAKPVGVAAVVAACWFGATPRSAAQAQAQAQAPAPAAAIGGAQQVDIAGNEFKRYYLIGPSPNAAMPASGWKLLLILPGGDGSADFLPFCTSIQSSALPAGFVVAQIVAPQWSNSPDRVVWPTRTLNPQHAAFTTEQLIREVVTDVSARMKVDPRCVLALGWSSSGPALYSDSLQAETPITGYFVAMSVFRPDWLPKTTHARGRAYFILHSPDDRMIPINAHAEVAAKRLQDAGARVKLVTYAGGHGWTERPMDFIRQGVEWLQAPSPPVENAVALAAVAKHSVPGLVAGCTTAAGLEQVQWAGVRRAGGHDAIARTDRMHLGSCTKAFTATLAAACVADGVLSWQSTVGQVLGSTEPGMDAGWKGVTLEQLLRHRGGAPTQADRSDWARAWNCTDPPHECRAAFVRAMVGRPPAQAPGTYAYSNQGYALAGRMCEVAGGQPYEAMLASRVLEPLGIVDYGFGAPVAHVPDSPHGHRTDGTPDDTDNPSSIAPAGTLHMPVEQWLKFVAFHVGAAPPPALAGAAKELAHLHKAGTDPPGEALGWMVAARPWGGTVLTHAGSNTLWYCVAWLSPEKQFAVVAACNQGGPAAVAACDEACAALIQAHTSRQQSPK